ncbi:putative ribokinase protein [Triangularia verruculosa]|uniref:Ribokinase protein n=1 Tax=Triangularia verruculosa TaxID=2587418 RepID=A0AAN6X7R7_9PEZI|nr:putative ribokinase protein [Triangularia verruculosa]
MTPHLITIIGGLDVDLIMTTPRLPNPGESLPATQYTETLGGKGANSAIATYRSCHSNHPSSPSDDSITINVKLIGTVGSDHHGPKFITKLAANGIDTSGILTIPNTPTSICVVIIETPTKENRCLFFPGATAAWKPSSFLTPLQLGGGVCSSSSGSSGNQLPDLIIAQMELTTPVVETIIETAGKAAIPFCLNAAPAPSPPGIADHLYRYLTHLIVNEHEAAAIISNNNNNQQVNKHTWKTIAQKLLNKGVKNVVITLGKQGAFYANNQESGRCPAYDCKRLLLTGRKKNRDTFTGAYCSEYLRQQTASNNDGRNWDIRSAVVRGNKAAAMTVMRGVGAQEGIPWADEIDGFDAPLLV